MKKILFPLIMAGMMVTSCEKNPVEHTGGELKFGRGVFVVNEGQFLSSNASISFYDPVHDTILNHVFMQANEVPLGDIAYSMTIRGKEAYIVVNNSGKIYRVSLEDMTFKSKITGLDSPRLILPQTNEDRAYITDLYSPKILVVSPSTGIRLDSIHTGRAGRSTEAMVMQGSLLYVSCWSFGDRLLVIDTWTNEIIDSITVGKQPNSMVIDGDNNLWVLSDGGFPGSSYGQENASLSRISLEDRSVERMHTWSDINLSPTDLCINGGGDTLYLVADGVFRFTKDMKGLENPFLPMRGRQIYSLGVDPYDGSVYIGDAVDYQQEGLIYRYNSTGALLDSARAGINPGYFCFTDIN